MPRLHHFLKGALLTLAFALFVSAQTATTTPAELSIIIGENKVKFTPLNTYQEMRLAVFNSVNELIYDSGALAEAELNWNLHDSNGQRLKPGLYAYTLSLKTPDAAAPRQHQGHFILEKGSDQIWLTTKGEGSVGAEVTGGELTVARSPERTTAGTGYVASGRTLAERTGTQRDTQSRTVAEQGRLTPETSPTLNQTGSGTPNRLTKWLTASTLGDSVIHETAAGDLGIGTTTPGGVLDVQRSSPNPLIGRFWNTGTGPAQLRFVGGTGATSQFLITDTAEWLTSIAVSNSIGMQLRVRGVGTPNNETELSNSARIAILRNGNVGIGNPVPGAKLDVAGDIRSSALRQELNVNAPPNIINGFMGTGSGGATPGNRVTPGVVGANIGGGGFNGTLNFPSGVSLAGDNSNRVTDWFGTVGGGLYNRAGNDDGTLDNAYFATVGGGYINTASGYFATVGGGQSNTASGFAATVSGGELNTANSGSFATVGGGTYNTASGYVATVSGGAGNTASGSLATVSGGRFNIASGDYSFAAGRNAKANHHGAFVWGDSTDADFLSTANNQFLIRAAGGVGIGTNSPGSFRLNVNNAGSDGLRVQTDTPGAGGRVASFGGFGAFNIDSPGVPGGRLTVQENGNVGIGTTAPGSARLNVLNEGSDGLRVATGTAGGTVASFGGIGEFKIDSPGLPGGRLIVQENGNVGIGITIPAPFSKLHVAGNVCAANVSCASDVRLKTQVTSLQYGLRQVMQLRPVSWKWKDETEQQLPLGLIAQEVQPVMPELVMPPQPSSDLLGLNYMGLLPVMVKAVQEQQAQIQQLLQANQQLRQRLSQVERRSKTQRR